MSVAIKATPAYVTLLDALTGSFAAALSSPDGTADPVALLWTDADGHWQEVARRLRSELPEFFTYGEFDPDERTGPAIWLRCIVDRTLPEAAPQGTIPIIYLPKVSRQELRAAGDCPAPLRPLVELQYRGTVWHQKNGRDWTVEAFFMSADGLALEVARDGHTRDAAIRNLGLLLDTPVEALLGFRLTADDFDKLAVPDAQRDLLLWMHDPDGFRASHLEAEWQAFRNIVRSDFGFDPEEDGPLAAGQKLMEGEGPWGKVWQRFAEAPARYRGLSRLLREPLPGQASLLVEPARQPGLNEEAENRLQSALTEIVALGHAEACQRIIDLDAEHGERRAWVWAELGESPFAIVLEHLAVLATAAQTTLGGQNVMSMADAYAADGWRCDQAAIRALAAASGSRESDIVSAVVRVLYEPWLDATARQFQKLVGKDGAEIHEAVTGESPISDTCVVFADGLRFDVAALLQARLEAVSLQTRLEHSIAPLPTVTATAKPFATTAHQMLRGAANSPDFCPVLSESGKSATTNRLKDAMLSTGVQVIEGDEVQMPGNAEATGWTEIGRLDATGHKMGAGLALHVDREVDRIANRVTELLDAGWGRVRVVTDHGWLLLPGGLPKIELPKYLVESRWSRCATIKEGATPDVTTYGWHWNQQARIACPPGAGAYTKTEYSHGGVSPQECVVPVLDVERGTPAVTARIAQVEWHRFRCEVQTTGADSSIQADIRQNWKKADSSVVLNPKPVGEDGEVSFPVSDEYEGQAVTVVLVDQGGKVISRQNTTVGEG